MATRVTRGRELRQLTCFISLALSTTANSSRTSKISHKLFLALLLCVSVFLCLPSLRSRPRIPAPLDTMPAPFVLEAVGKHTATVIFAHGLGDTAAGWIPLARELQPKFKHVKWVLPTAPEQPVSINMGMRMTSWFDIQVKLFAACDPETVFANLPPLRDRLCLPRT